MLVGHGRWAFVGAFPGQLLLLLLPLLIASGCGGARRKPTATPEATVIPAPTASVAAPSGGNGGAALAGAPTSQPSSKQIPVAADDPVWGDATAPVTIVAFMDLQGPFCKRAEATLDQLRGEYGPHKLRLVFKHLPLRFHPRAEPAAVAAQAVFEIAGAQTFFAFVDQIYSSDQQDLSKAQLERWATGLGVDVAALRQHIAAGKALAKVKADDALARQVHALGTPNFRINGIQVNGAQPIDKFKKVIDAELARVDVLRSNGVGAEQVYARRVAANYVAQPPVPAYKPPPEDTTIWKIPIGKSPISGPRDALVTIVEFADFQCPFCKRVQGTLAQLMKHYPGELRIVFKHLPLPFHKRAMPAAMLAIEAQHEQGNAGFFRAVKALYASSPNLDDQDLVAIAKQLHLDAARVKRAVAKLSYKKLVEKDSQLADEFSARGTPHFFINGYRVAGAQPVAKFEKVIDAQLAKARTLLKQGVAPRDVYAHIMKSAKMPPPPAYKQVAAPSRANPSQGPAHAPIVIQEFGDFQCPFTKRAQKTIATLEKAYPGRIRVVWRNLPLPFHKHARMAAEAALEAYAQKGTRGYSKMRDLLFANQYPSSGLERPALERYAAQLHLDMRRFNKALDEKTHAKQIAADEQAAKRAQVSGTPAFFVNGYFISGAQPLIAFKRAVDYALRHRHKRKP